MIPLSTTQQTIIDSKFKKVDWLFIVHDVNAHAYYWSTKDIHATTNTSWAVSPDGIVQVDFSAYAQWYCQDFKSYTFQIVDFQGIGMYRSKGEAGLVAASDLEFSVINRDSALNPKLFVGCMVKVALRVSDGVNPAMVIRRWRFKIKKATPQYQKFTCVCEDYLQSQLKGDYPNNKMIDDIFGATSDVSHNNVCEPIPFGTAYVPLRSIFIADGVSAIGNDISAGASNSGARCMIRRSRRIDFSKFETGRSITISGFATAANNGEFTVAYASSNRIELSATAGIVDEAAGAVVTITQGSRFYVLGRAAKFWPVVNYTYAISEVRSPRSWGQKSTWSGEYIGNYIKQITGLGAFIFGSYHPDNPVPKFYAQLRFPQYSKTDSENIVWTTFQPMIADTNNDGKADSIGVWRQGSVFLDMPTKFTRSDTVSTTNPAEVLKYILIDMGAGNVDLSSFAIAAAKYNQWSLEWNGALWYKESRKTLLSRLLVMCNSNLVSGESIELYPLSNESQKMITAAEILKRGDIGEGSFRYTDITEDKMDDCGYIAWQKTGEAQDAFIKTICPAKSGVFTRVSKTICDLQWVNESSNAQRLGHFFFQRTLAREANVSFTTKGTCLALNPGDVVTIQDENITGHRPYGGGTLLQWAPPGLGAELVTNGFFSAAIGTTWVNDAVGPYPYDTLEIAGGKLHLVTDGGTITHAGSQDSISLFAGKRYQITWTQAITSGVGSRFGIVNGLLGAGGVWRYPIGGPSILGAGIFTDYFTATVTENAVFGFYNIPADGPTEFTIDDVSVKEVTGSQWSDAQYDEWLFPGGHGTNWDSLNYDVVIDSMKISKDLAIEFTATKYSCKLDDWYTIWPDANVPVTDDLKKMWQPAISGPLSDEAQSVDIGIPYKTYLTVSPIDKAGDHTSIQEAISAMPDTNASGIYIKNGHYYIDQPWILPSGGAIYLPSDRDFEIIGESIDNTVIHIIGQTSEGFVIGASPYISLTYIALPKRYFFSTFSMDSDAVQTLILCSANMVAANHPEWHTGKLICEHLKLTAFDYCTGVKPSATNVFGTTAISSYGHHPKSKFETIISKCSFINGTYGVLGSSTGIMTVKDCNFIGQKKASVLMDDCANVTIVNNIIKDFHLKGISAAADTWVYSPVTATTSNITGNQITSLDAKMDIDCTGISIQNQAESLVTANQIIIKRSTTGSVYGIADYATGSRNRISGNIVKISGVVSTAIYGLYGATASNTEISGNNVDIDASSENIYGVYLIG